MGTVTTGRETVKLETKWCFGRMGLEGLKDQLLWGWEVHDDYLSKKIFLLIFCKSCSQSVIPLSAWLGAVQECV